MIRKITIINVRRPPQIDLNQELQVFGRMLGLFGERDRDRSCFRIFIELLKAKKLHLPLSSDELSERLNLSRGTVVHHINNMLERGLIAHEGRRYVLRSENLEQLILDLQRDAELAFRELRKTARELDAFLNL